MTRALFWQPFSSYKRFFITTKSKTITIPHPPEYQVLRKDRNSKARGRGFFIAVKKHIEMT